MPLYIIAIDLGKTGGALSLLKQENKVITVIDYLKTKENNKDKQIKFIVEAKLRYEVSMVIIEEPYLQSKQQGATTSFIQLGWFQGILDYLTLNHMLVKPRKWQEIISKYPIDDVINKEYKGNSNRNNKGETKKLSLSYVKANHPNIAIRGPRGGFYDGLADSICIGEYYFRYINK